MSGPRVSVWVKALVLAHFALILAWSAPIAPHLGMRIAPIATYMKSTGLWQHWDMFAPRPLRIDNYVTAKVYFANGTHYEYSFPRMATMGYIERYVQERHRKFWERSLDPDRQYLWPALAEFARRQAPNGDQAVEVELWRHYRLPPRIGEPPNAYQSYAFYRHLPLP